MNASSSTEAGNSVLVAPSSLHTIRPLQPSDVPHLRQLLIETNVFNSDEIDIALELIHTVLNNPDQKDYIIHVYDDREVGGYYCIGPTPATAATYDLYWIAVKPSLQRKGIGKKLNTHAEKLMRMLGGSLIVAETSSTQRYDKTRQFYLDTGYAELARIRAYYRPGDDLVVYGKYLS